MAVLGAEVLGLLRQHVWRHFLCCRLQLVLWAGGLELGDQDIIMHVGVELRQRQGGALQLLLPPALWCCVEEPPKQA